MARAKPQNTKKSNFHKETKLQSEVKIKVKPALLQYHKGVTERGSIAQETFTSNLFLRRRQSSAICKEYLSRTRN